MPENFSKISIEILLFSHCASPPSQLSKNLNRLLWQAQVNVDGRRNFSRCNNSQVPDVYALSDTNRTTFTRLLFIM